MLKKIIKWVFIIILVIVGLIILAFGGLMYMMAVAPFTGANFDKTVWDAAITDQADLDCVRGPMYADLKSHYLAKGTSRVSVTELLGKTQNRSYGGCLSYNLGMCSGFKIDYDSLDICFDSADKVLDVNHFQH